MILFLPRSSKKKEFCELQARLIDIPFLLQHETKDVKELHEVGDKTTIKSSILFPFNDVKDFYTSEMDVKGWHLRNSVELQIIAIFYYEKPHSFCFIMLQPQLEGDTEIVISTGLKQKNFKKFNT